MEKYSTARTQRSPRPDGFAKTAIFLLTVVEPKQSKGQIQRSALTSLYGGKWVVRLSRQLQYIPGPEPQMP